MVILVSCSQIKWKNGDRSGGEKPSSLDFARICRIVGRNELDRGCETSAYGVNKLSEFAMDADHSQEGGGGEQLLA